MKISVFSVCIPEYGIPETVNMLKKLGYDGVEWRVSTPPPAVKPADYTFDERYWSYNLSTIDINSIDIVATGIKSSCDAAGLEISSIATYLCPWDVMEIEKVIKAARIMNCKNIRVLAPNYDGTENYRNLFEKTSNQVKILERLAEKNNVRINFEIHMGNIIPSASAAFRLINGCNPQYIGIIYDPGNMVYEGFENYKLGMELLGEYLAHVHVKNGVWKLKESTKEGVELWKPVWSPFKKGFVNFKNLISALESVNYKGYISVEDFSNEEDTYTKLKGNIQYLRSMFKE